MKTFKTKLGTELPLLNLRGKDYLQVAFRLVWMRESHPTWSIETSFPELTETSAFAKATIKNEEGVVLATAHKHEVIEGFADFREKAETGAIGRALALCGFGTQFTTDLDEGDKIVDSPVMPPHSERPLEDLNVYRKEPGAPAIHLDKPREYRIPFGKYRSKGLHEVKRENLQAYCNYILDKAAKENRSQDNLSDAVKDFLSRASRYLKTT